MTDSFLTRACCKIVLPWETGVFAEISGNQPCFQVYARCVKSTPDRDYVESLDLEWTKADSRWLAILEGAKLDSSVGSHICLYLSSGDRANALACARDAC